MILEIDETDFQFVTQMLCRAKSTHQSLMVDPNHCQTVRDRSRENAKMAQTAYDLMYDAKKKGDAKRPQKSDDYVRKLEKALDPVLSVEGAIEQAKRTDRKITCREDERLFQSLDAVAEAQEIMQPVIAIGQAAAEVKAKMAEATA